MNFKCQANFAIPEEKYPADERLCEPFLLFFVSRKGAKTQRLNLTRRREDAKNKNQNFEEFPLAFSARFPGEVKQRRGKGFRLEGRKVFNIHRQTINPRHCLFRANMGNKSRLCCPPALLRRSRTSSNTIFPPAFPTAPGSMRRGRIARRF